MMHTLMINFLTLICIVNFAGNETLDESRTWEDKSGKFSVQAEMISVSEGKVKLKRDDGKIIDVAISRLSQKDQRYIRSTLLARKKSTAKKAESTSTDANNSNASKDWFQWRGPDRDGVSKETGLLQSWPEAGPDLLWTANELGSGMSSVSIAGGKLYTIGNRNGSENLIALDVKNGKELWSARIGNGGESNSTPTVDGDLVFAVGRGGDLICAETATGKVLWRKNFGSDFGGKMMSQWGYSESPLVDGDRLICTPGSERAMIAALDKKTGKTIWATPMKYGGSRGTDGAGYASVVVSNGGGVRQFITLVGRGLISVNAKDGRPLWQYEKVANGTANVPTPIISGDYVFCSSGYGDGGSALLKLSGRNGKVNFQEVYYRKAGELQNHHGGMIRIGDYVFMGHGHNKGFPMCVEMKTGRKMWERQRGPGDGSAAIVAADGHLYFRYENGIMALIEANPREYKLKGSFRIKTVHKQSWPHPVIQDGKLYLRDAHQLHCYDISRK